LLLALPLLSQGLEHSLLSVCKHSGTRHWLGHTLYLEEHLQERLQLGRIFRIAVQALLQSGLPFCQKG
jgi:hypothetical protein